MMQRSELTPLFLGYMSVSAFVLRAPQWRVPCVTCRTQTYTPQGTKTYASDKIEAGEWKDGKFVGQVGDALPYMVDLFPRTHARYACR